MTSLVWLKKISCVTRSFCKIFLTPKQNIPSVAPFPWPAAQYVRIILGLNSLTSFWRRKKRFLFLYCVGALSLWIRSWFLMLYLLMISQSACSTNTGSWMMWALKSKWYREPVGSTIEQWRMKCFPENWVDGTSSLGRKAEFCDRYFC